MNVVIVQYNPSLQCPDMSRISVFHVHDHVILLDILVVYYMVVWHLLNCSAAGNPGGNSTYLRLC